MRAAADGDGLVRLDVGPVKAYLVSDPDLVRHVLVGNAGNYIKGSMMDGIRFALGNGLFNSDRDFWRRQRRLMQLSGAVVSTRVVGCEDPQWGARAGGAGHRRELLRRGSVVAGRAAVVRRRCVDVFFARVGRRGIGDFARVVASGPASSSRM